VKALVLHAPNVHQGGGRALLRALIAAALPRGELRLIVDSRFDVPDGVGDSDVAARVTPSIMGRLYAENVLRQIAGPSDTVLCFGNLPPLFRLPSRVCVFVQNRYLVQPHLLGQLAWRARVRIAVERLWLRWCQRNADRFIVQTPTMQRFLRERLRADAEIMPFAGSGSSQDARPRPSGREWRFVYVASGERHKNHRNLLEAWCALAARGVRPELCLTLDRRSDHALVHWIEQRAASAGLKVHIDAAADGDADRLYRESDALVYPSLVESFGLPLVEARRHGLPVIAAELDVVRDVLDPEETFDPSSPLSIARAILRFMGVPQQRVVHTPEEFLDRLSD
jgi:glycosyltransferase involved in cell wall biosynthesis